MSDRRHKDVLRRLASLEAAVLGLRIGIEEYTSPTEAYTSNQRGLDRDEMLQEFIATHGVNAAAGWCWVPVNLEGQHQRFCSNSANGSFMCPMHSGKNWTYYSHPTTDVPS